MNAAPEIVKSINVIICSSQRAPTASRSCSDINKGSVLQSQIIQDKLPLMIKFHQGLPHRSVYLRYSQEVKLQHPDCASVAISEDDCWAIYSGGSLHENIDLGKTTSSTPDHLFSRVVFTWFELLIII